MKKLTLSQIIVKVAKTKESRKRVTHFKIAYPEITVTDQKSMPALPENQPLAAALIESMPHKMQYNENNVGYYDGGKIRDYIMETLLMHYDEMPQKDVAALADYYNALIPTRYYETHVWNEDGKTFKYGISTDIENDFIPSEFCTTDGADDSLDQAMEHVGKLYPRLSNQDFRRFIGTETLFMNGWKYTGDRAYDFDVNSLLHDIPGENFSSYAHRLTLNYEAMTKLNEEIKGTNS